MPQIIVNVSKEGNTTVSVEGVAGAGCRDLTKSLEVSLGTVSKVELTSAYYEEAQTGAMQEGQH